MNKIAFESMNKGKRALYECMWGSEAFDLPVERTKQGNLVSNNSYTFTDTSGTNEDICRDRLAELFGIKCRALFKDKFAQSCGGSGQELKNIARLHSSSLCALLFFYNVSGENPYIMEIGGEEYVFTYSRFEYQNKVISDKSPSNIDVVLIGKASSSGKPTVLFLESKFSEYYEYPRRQLRISRAYLENDYGKVLYEGALPAEMGLYATAREGDKSFVLSSEIPCYLEGIKQMISHYIGIRNLFDSPDRRENAVTHAVLAGAKVLLGEILFTKGIGQLPVGNGGECLTSYRKKYIILADALNKQLKKDVLSDRFTVLSDILSYSQFQDKEYIQEPQVKRFYFELGK